MEKKLSEVSEDSQQHSIMESATWKQIYEQKDRNFENLSKEYTKLFEKLKKSADETDKLQRQLSQFQFPLSNSSPGASSPTLTPTSKVININGSVHEKHSSFGDNFPNLEFGMIDDNDSFLNSPLSTSAPPTSNSFSNINSPMLGAAQFYMGNQLAEMSSPAAATKNINDLNEKFAKNIRTINTHQRRISFISKELVEKNSEIEKLQVDHVVEMSKMKNDYEDLLQKKVDESKSMFQNQFGWKIDNFRKEIAELRDMNETLRSFFISEVCFFVFLLFFFCFSQISLSEIGNFWRNTTNC